MSSYYHTDGGRSGSRRPKQSNDCVIRAVAVALERSYDEVYDTFAELGRKSGRGTSKAAWQSWLSERARRVAFPAVKGVQRTSLESFCRHHGTGVWVVQIAKHLVAVRDGVVHDDGPPRWGACVYAAWEVRS